MIKRAKDPVCGMNVDKDKAEKLEKNGKTYYFCSKNCKKSFQTGEKSKGHDHSAHHKHMVEDFKKRFWISLVITIPVLILSPMIQSFFGFQVTFSGVMIILFGLSTIIFFYGGWPFLSGLVNELKEKRPGMMTLIGLAITVAYVYSGLVVFGLKGKVFFWELVTLIDIMLLGHWIEMKSVMGASRALEELAKLMPKEAHKITEDGSTDDVKVDQLRSSDRVLIKPGEKIPVDGKIIKGDSEVNEAMLTGESKPIHKKKGDQVIGGSVNGSGSLTAAVSKTGEDSYLSQVVNLVKEASQSKSKAQGFADKAAFWLTLIAIGAGFITLVSWLLFGKDFVFSLERMVTVMVITCPHALGLAVPLVIAVITSLSAKNGLLIRQRTPFENARNLDVIVFDKTGTLTKGEFGVTDIINLSKGENDDQLLAKVASLENNSEHTIAKGILKKAKEKELKLKEAEGFEAISGKGAKAKIEGKEIYVGNKELIEQLSLEAKDATEKINKLAKDGKTAVFAIWDNTVQAIFGLSDIIRDESKEAIAELKKLRYQVSMITGDNQETAKFVAGELGLDSYFSQVLPDKKSEKIKKLQNEGKKVAMVGDGVNDAPALAQADLGIAIGTGTDVAAETADIVLVESDPRSVVDAIKLSKITYRKTLQNLSWATGYNLFAIPLAAGVLYKYGIVLAPAVGALIMSLSTIIVAINAKLIKFDN
ncbi:MAG: copper-translocating P-type ATPase [Candidatus Omnitrophota bacterium]